VRPLGAEIDLVIEPRLTSIRSDKAVMANVLLNMLESALGDPNRESKIKLEMRAEDRSLAAQD